MEHVDRKEPPFAVHVLAAFAVIAATTLVIGSDPPARTAAYRTAIQRFSPAGPSGDPGAAGYETLRQALIARPSLASRIRRMLAKGDIHASDVVEIAGVDAQPAQTDLDEQAARADLGVTLRGI